MKVSKAHEKDKFNVMTWEWIAPDQVSISLVHNKSGKSGKMRAKVADGKLTEILEDEEMK